MTTEEAARIFVDGVFRCEPDEVKSRLNCAIPPVASRLSVWAVYPSTRRPRSQSAGAVDEGDVGVPLPGPSCHLNHCLGHSYAWCR